MRSMVCTILSRGWIRSRGAYIGAVLRGPPLLLGNPGRRSTAEKRPSATSPGGRARGRAGGQAGLIAHRTPGPRVGVLWGSKAPMIHGPARHDDRAAGRRPRRAGSPARRTRDERRPSPATAMLMCRGLPAPRIRQEYYRHGIPEIIRPRVCQPTRVGCSGPDISMVPHPRVIGPPRLVVLAPTSRSPHTCGVIHPPRVGGSTHPRRSLPTPLD